MKTRRAMSLLELLVIMSACTVLLTLTSALLSRAMRIQVESRANENAERTALRLSEQFRSDVHAARKVANEEANGVNNSLLRIELADGRIAAYSVTNGRILREESGADQPTWREEYAFPPATTIAMHQADSPQRIVLSAVNRPIAQPEIGQQTSLNLRLVPLALQVEAVVGRNLRFRAQPGQEPPK